MFLAPFFLIFAGLGAALCPLLSKPDVRFCAVSASSEKPSRRSSSNPQRCGGRLSPTTSCSTATIFSVSVSQVLEDVVLAKRGLEEAREVAKGAA